MNKRKLFQKNGITLIALVISIIVMLILAGVSLNAVIGDNGIITQAQNATYMQSIAVLEEYLNNYYVEHYEEMEQTDNKAEALQKFSESSNWIWNPSKYGYGAVGYIIDSDGNMCYFINKEGLPEEIRSSLKGGDAGEGTYADYASYNDVYGVTANLKVYYSNSGKDSILGVSKDDLEKENPLREVFQAGSEMAKLITGKDDTAVTIQDLKSVKTLTIDSTSGITNLSELYNLTSLQELNLKDLNLNSLEGIQNAVQLSYIKIENCKINDYSSIAGVDRNLMYLYMINTTDEQVNLLCEAMKNTDFANLQYFGLYDSGSNLTNIDKLVELSKVTKESIKYLYLYNNNISSISALSEFINIKELEVNNNASLITLAGCENMNSLIYLDASYCNLGANEIYDTNLDNSGRNEASDALSAIDNLNNISKLYLSNNINLKWVDYIVNYDALQTLSLANNNSMTNESFINIKAIVLKLKGVNCSYPSKYEKLLNSNERMDLVDSNLTNSSEEYLALMNNTSLKQLRLDNNVNLQDEGTYSINNVLKTCTSMEVLCLRNINIDNIYFVQNMPNLKELDLRETNVTDLSFLELYCPNLKTLILDNEDVDLTKIQKTISNMNLGLLNVAGTFFTNAISGLIATNPNVYKKLEECTEITNLTICGRTMYDSLQVANIDLSKCVKLETVNLDSVKINIKYPSQVKNVNLSWRAATNLNDFNNCTKMNYLNLYQPSGSSFNNTISSLNNIEITSMNLNYVSDFKIFETISENAKIHNITVARQDYIGNVSIANLDALQYINGLTSLSISGYKLLPSFSKDTALNKLTGIYISDSSFDNIEFVKNAPNLKTIKILNSNIKSLKGIENNTSLTEINLSGNSISSTKELENLTQLSSLNLENNCIYDTSTYIDTSGETITYNNLDILANLNRNGNLRYLYLSGNKGIINWSPLSSISNWTGKSGW